MVKFTERVYLVIYREMKFSKHQENCAASNITDDFDSKEAQKDCDGGKILCNHCKRTLDNGIRCLGICVADNDY